MSAAATDRDPAPLFRPRTLRWLWIVGGVSLLLSMASLFTDDGSIDPTSNRPGHPLGRSAVGWGALVELLDARGLTTRTGRRVADVSDPRALTVLLEPLVDPDAGASETLLRAVQSADTLLVLPKWTVRRRTHNGPVISARLRSKDDAQEVLDALLASADVLRPGSVHWMPKGERVPELPAPQLLDVRGGEVLIEATEGVLAWRTTTPDGRDLVVLSDPDLLANHGLGRGDNAELATTLIDGARKGRPVHLSRLGHGWDAPPALMDELLGWPLVLVPLQVAILLVVLLTASVRRRRPVTPLATGPGAGKRPLIDTTAALLLHGDHAAEMLPRYAELCERRAADGLNLPADLGNQHRRRRLLELSASRQLTTPAAHADDADAAHILERARLLHAWKEDLVHGPR